MKHGKKKLRKERTGRNRKKPATFLTVTEREKERKKTIKEKEKRERERKRREIVFPYSEN